MKMFLREISSIKQAQILLLIYHEGAIKRIQGMLNIKDEKNFYLLLYWRVQLRKTIGHTR